MKLLKTDSVISVKEKLYENFSDIEIQTEIIDIRNCVGRYISHDIYSDIDNPAFTKSVVDGYAIISKDSFGVTESIPVFLKVKGFVEMGMETNLEIKSGECVYVPTGGVIPKGADAVCMIEYTEKLDEKTIALYKPSAPGNGLINKGDDFKEKDLIFKKGKRLGTKDIGMMAATGNKNIKVFKKPIITIISTGDEIVDVGQFPKTGEIRDINSYALVAMIEEVGCEVLEIKVIKDEYETYKKALNEAIESSDMVVVSGGSSAGMKDMTVDVINESGKPGVFTHGVALKPGKPTILANVSGKPVFGLPGHPVSAILVFKAIVEEFLVEYYFKSKINKITVKARITESIHNGEGKETYQFVNLIKNDNEKESELKAVPIFAKSSAIRQVMAADGYIKIDSLKEGIKDGELIDVFLV